MKIEQCGKVSETNLLLLLPENRKKNTRKHIKRSENGPAPLRNNPTAYFH